MSSGVLISISGIDGSGKSTQALMLESRLREEGLGGKAVKTDLHAFRSVLQVTEAITGDRFAYDPLIPSTLREFTVACDVLRFSEEVLRPAADAGLNLIWDRGPLCYEVYCRCYGADVEWPLKVLSLVRRPDLTVLIDLDPEVAVARLRCRESKPRQADEGLELLTRARRTYLDVATGFGNVVVVDGSGPVLQVAATVWSAVATRLPSWGTAKNADQEACGAG